MVEDSPEKEKTKTGMKKEEQPKPAQKKSKLPISLAEDF